MTYTTDDAKQFARIAVNLFKGGDVAPARAASQAFYDVTRNQPNANELHEAFRAEVEALNN